MINETATSRVFGQSKISGGARMSIGIAAACFLTVPACSGVTILWEQYHCSGGMQWNSPDYSITDAGPVLGKNSFGESRSWKLGASADTGGSSGYAAASSTFILTTDSPILIIKYSGTLYSTAFPDSFGGVSYTLSDNSTDAIIDSHRWSLAYTDAQHDLGNNWFALTFIESLTYNIVAGHEYKLLLSADVTNADGTSAYLNATLIPEPSFCLLLGIGGLGGLVLRRRI